MISAQNIRDVRFTKTMGGYKAAEVDSFLDQCADTIEALCQENEENTRKMQVLAETIVDYRNQEDSIRTALMSAQRMSETVVKEAEEKASQMIEEAEEKAKSIVIEAEEKANTIDEQSKKNIQSELEELARIQKEVIAFRSRLLSTYREHLTLIGVLSEEVNEQEEPQVPVSTDGQSDDAEPMADASEENESTFANDVKIDISAFELKDEE